MMKALAIIPRDDLLPALEDDQGGGLRRGLAQLCRRGYRLVLIAPQPERWRPTRRSMDEALAEQQRIRESLDTAGAPLDGIYYYATGFFGQKRQRQQMLEELLLRCGLPSSMAVMIASGERDLDCARQAGFHLLPIQGPEDDSLGARPFANLRAAVEHLAHADAPTPDTPTLKPV